MMYTKLLYYTSPRSYLYEECGEYIKEQSVKSFPIFRKLKSGQPIFTIVDKQWNVIVDIYDNENDIPKTFYDYYYIYKTSIKPNMQEIIG